MVLFVARVKITKCPSCHAQLPSRMDDGIVTCAYCGKEAIIKHTVFLHRPKVQAPSPAPVNYRGGRPQPSPVGPLPLGGPQRLPVRGRGRKKGGANVVMVAWIAVPLLMSGAIAGVIALNGAASVGVSGEQGASEGEGEGATGSNKITDYRSDFSIYDIDGDGTEDLVASYLRWDSEASESITRIGTFSGKNQQQLWRTETFEKSPRLHLHGNRLFAADSKLGLSVLDVKTGATIHKLTTGDKVEEFCDKPSGDATWVSLSDETGILVNHADGKGVEENLRPAYCGEERQYHECPSKPVGKSCEEWNPRTTIIKPPFVYVEKRKKCLKLNPKRSGAWMHAGKCRRKKIDGMKGSVLLGHEESFIAIGHKHPGTQFPMIAGLEDQALLWHRLIDQGPVENRENLSFMRSEHLGEFGDGQFLQVYKDKLGYKLIAIDLKTGENRFLKPIVGSEKFNLVRFHLTASRIYVLFSSGRLRIFDPATGNLVGQFGD